jgi:hypothetical protein
MSCFVAHCTSTARILSAIPSRLPPLPFPSKTPCRHKDGKDVMIPIHGFCRM